jgi:hypothetical protein
MPANAMTVEQLDAAQVGAASGALEPRSGKGETIVFASQ